jgi:hypothetical protein
LNEEQERAFRIVANHATELEPEQLKMYIAGMAGTGKSQVIKALMRLFDVRGEPHRFIILGPTGTAAALNNGSTYHSFLGIRVGGSYSKRDEAISIAQLKERLHGVDYIFFDEVSMLACHELYTISSQLAKALNEYSTPFGGMNMIFAGDFAQLAPVGGKSLYSNAVTTQLTAGLSLRDQEAAIGKALWHQITTVVILRQNMRQRMQTTEDSKLRSALTNMRYGKCTPDDIKFLKTLIAGPRLEQPKPAAKEFRNIAIICGRHTQKDQINMLGCERFARETGQQLTNFYSIDYWAGGSTTSTGESSSRRRNIDLSHQSQDISSVDQMHIWNLRPGATEHFPGKLSLCLGIPVMIRNNEATELCITKGQEGFVVGWQSITGPHGKLVLDTLFVELYNPPRVIKIPGLPDNVVPIVKDKKTVQCILPSDDKVNIERQQVWVLPNFSMTDYASQGKTRPFNVVHLSSCVSHQSYYTCLSRSASAAGTIIIQGFEPRVITGGCSGYLRQEFREQEILDDITKLRFEDMLPHYIEGNRRNTLIRQYQKWKGISHVPKSMDKHLSWITNDKMDMLPVVTDSPWQLIDKSKKSINKMSIGPVLTTFVPAKGTASLAQTSVKRKFEDDADNNQHLHIRKAPRTEEVDKPLGLIWDSKDYSCAYDAVLTILYDIWKQNPFMWNVNGRFLQAEHLNFLSKGFKNVHNGQQSLEKARDQLRRILHNENQVIFPYGYAGTSVELLIREIVKGSTKIGKSQFTCTKCDFASEPAIDQLKCMIEMDGNTVSRSTSHFVHHISHATAEKCPDCEKIMRNEISFKFPPSILAFDHSLVTTVKPSRQIKFKLENRETVILQLRGLVYFGNFHFTSRVISTEGDIWYSDGKDLGRTCLADGHSSLMHKEDWQTCKNNTLLLSIYAKV